jgi:hypothetical protein
MYATDASSSGLGNPLLLRKVPPERQHIAETVAGPIATAGCTWWELTEAAADLNQPPAAVAVTRVGANQAVEIDLLATGVIRSGTVLVHLLSELLAALRRSDAMWVCISAPDEPSTTAALLAVGFSPVPRRGAGAAPATYTVSL